MHNIKSSVSQCSSDLEPVNQTGLAQQNPLELACLPKINTDSPTAIYKNKDKVNSPFGQATIKSSKIDTTMSLIQQGSEVGIKIGLWTAASIFKGAEYVCLAGTFATGITGIGAVGAGFFSAFNAELTPASGSMVSLGASLMLVAFALKGISKNFNELAYDTFKKIEDKNGHWVPL